VRGVSNIVATDSVFAETESWWLQTLRDVDVVIHLAWYVEPGKYLTAPENLDCLCGTLRMAKAAATAGVRRFVGIGTCFEYDLTNGRMSTDAALRPLTLYAATKASTYIALSQWLPQNNVEFAWCRLFYLYGEGEDQRRFVPYLRKCLSEGKAAELTNGLQVRDFLDVRDAASMIVDCATGINKGPINICSGIPITIRAFAERIADEYGRRDLLNFGARPDNEMDPPYVVGVR
jgi:dTDP-6-deoxy-L-talose 4-dehydrogenase (NAD+)